MTNINDLTLENGMNYGEADARFRDTQEGTCIIIANGPSLNDVPNSFLKSYPSFGCNRIYLREDFTPTYFVQIGADQIQGSKFMDFVDICSEVDASFVNRMAVRKFEGIDNVYPILSRPLIPDGTGKGIGAKFSSHPLYAIGIGGSVIFQSFQLAYWMGFSVCLVVGLDHAYEREWSKPFHFYPNDETVTSREGPYGGHRSWVKRTDVTFMVAREAFSADGRSILNLTEGSACTVFPFSTVEAWTLELEDSDDPRQ